MNAITTPLRGLIAALAISATFLAQAETPIAEHGQHTMMTPQAEIARFPADFQTFIQQMDTDMSRMMTDMHSPGYTGNADVDFLVMMIPHHQGAVDMARLLQIHGVDPLTRRLAEEIIAGQQAEITAMKARLKILRGGADLDPGGYPALHGTRGQRSEVTPK